MATTDNNLQVINSMTEEVLSSLKDSDGKIPSLANQLVMTDDEDVNLSQWRTEVVYDMTSSDSNKNWGYQTGISSSTTISNKDFNKYQALIIYSNRASDDYGSTMSFIPLDKAQDNGTYVGQSVIYLTRLTSANSLLANTLITTINSAKTSITITFKQQYNTNHYEEASYRVYKIEGIIKQPSMIYTGAELHAGNGISIKDGVISSERPIGTYHICQTGSEDPAIKFGGTWVQVATNVVLPLGNYAPVVRGTGRMSGLQWRNLQTGAIMTDYGNLSYGSSGLTYKSAISVSTQSPSLDVSFRTSLSESDNAISGVDVWLREA